MGVGKVGGTSRGRPEADAAKKGPPRAPQLLCVPTVVPSGPTAKTPPSTVVRERSDVLSSNVPGGVQGSVRGPAPLLSSSDLAPRAWGRPRGLPHSALVPLALSPLFSVGGAGRVEARAEVGLTLAGGAPPDRPRPPLAFPPPLSAPSTDESVPSILAPDPTDTVAGAAVPNIVAFFPGATEAGAAIPVAEEASAAVPAAVVFAPAPQGPARPSPLAKGAGAAVATVPVAVACVPGRRRGRRGHPRC